MTFLDCIILAIAFALIAFASLPGALVLAIAFGVLALVRVVPVRGS